MSLPEVLLWNLLRGAPDGVVFRRQHSFDSDLTVDFYCAKAKLCIEIDGKAHDMGDNSAIDEERNERLRKLGMEVMRIPATQVLKSPEVVADGLVRYCER
jgi:very-short-patch-repair endonuclease